MSKTRWTISITTESRSDDSRIMQVLNRLNKEKFNYVVSSKEIDVPSRQRQLCGHAFGDDASAQRCTETLGHAMPHRYNGGQP